MIELHQHIPDTPIHTYYVDTADRVDKALNHLLQYDCLGFDLETYHSVNKRKKAFDPTDGARMRLAQWATPAGVAFVFDLYKVDRMFMREMFPNPFLCVIQNAKFELKYLMYELGIYDFGPIWDTMTAEKILSKGNVVYSKESTYVPVGLDDIAYRHLGVILPKDEQKSDWYKAELTESQIDYAARDAQIVLPIYQIQRELLKEQRQVRVNEVDTDAIPAFAMMELNGIHLDADRWLKICDDNKTELEKVQAQLQSDLGSQNTLFAGGRPSIDLGKRDLVMRAMEERGGFQIPLDRDGKKSLAKDNISGIDHPFVKNYLKHVKLEKSLSSFGPDWIDKRNPFDNRIHCDIIGIGAETGRMSAKNPNLMQMKKDEAYRGAFTAADGCVFIDADYSQCELRILAELCRDENLIFAFDQDYDLHRYSAHLIYKCVMELVTDLQRSVAKNLNFGIVYGIGVAKFAAQAHIPLEEAEAIMNYYLKVAYPNLGHWLEAQGKSVFYNLEARTMLGRIRKYNGDLADKQFKASVQRNAKNLPIQGTNADITKRALALVYKELVRRGLIQKVKMVLVIHDEILLESPAEYAYEAKYVLYTCMMQAEQEFLWRVKSKVDVDIALEWAKSVSPEQKAAAEELLRSYKQNDFTTS